MMMTNNNSADDFRFGFVALLGRPNVGKSTLVNALLEEKVSIVSPKPQTTRNRIHGILNSATSQIVFVDMPGMVSRGNALRRAMRKSIGSAVADSDLVLVIVEIRGNEPEITEVDEEVIRTAKQSGATVLLAINKIDKLPSLSALLPWMERFSKEMDLAGIIPISAKKRQGLTELVTQVESHLQKGEALFPLDLHTDQAERFLCEELIRESALMLLREEIPHALAVVIESFDERRRDEEGSGLIRIEGKILVEKESQKGIVVGKKGSQIKEISQRARIQMESVLGSKVFLRLAVKVDKDWTHNELAVARLGLDPEMMK